VNLNQIHAMLAGEVQRIVELVNSQLFAVGPITRTSRARIFPFTRMDEAGEELRWT